MPCTTLLAGKKATVDGSTMIARNEDYGHALNPKRFVVVKPADQPKEYQSITTKCKVDLPDNPMQYTALPENDTKIKQWVNGPKVELTLLTLPCQQPKPVLQTHEF